MAGSKNMYRTARLKAAKFNRLLNNMDTACGFLFISRRLLWEIENNQSKPTSETALYMATVYKAFSIINNYCAIECPLGKYMKVQPIREMPNDRILINTIFLLKKAEQIADNLMSAAYKTAASSSNETAAEAFSEWASELAQLSRELTVATKENQERSE
jgi:hypothetical protein